MHRTLIRTTLLAAAVALAPMAMAAPIQSNAPASSAAPAQSRSVLDELNLTQAQRNSIDAAQKQSFEQLRPMIASLQQRQQAFMQLQPGSSGYQSSVSSLAQAEGDFARTRVQQEGALRTKIWGILTASQRTKLQGILDQQMQQMRAAQQAQQAAPAASH